LPHEEARKNDPKGVHEHEIAPVIGGLRERVCHVEDIVIGHVGRVVEDVAVELAQRDDELERVAERVVVGDENSANKGERTPEGLSQRETMREKGRKTYSSDSLHAQYKGTLRQVPRVAQAVLLPQLAEQVLHASHVPEVVGEVALEKGVDASAQHKPHNSSKIRVTERQSYPLNENVGDGEDDSASGSKHADQLQRVPLIGKIAYNLRLDGLVRVLLPEEQCEIAGGHYKVCRV
jgi:hypothetical protein